MILNDIISDYKYTANILNTCSHYFDLCKKFTSDFYFNIFEEIENYFKKTAENSASLAGVDTMLAIDTVYNNAYPSLVDLIMSSDEFNNAVTTLMHYEYKTYALFRMIKQMNELSNQLKGISTDILKAQSSGMKSNKLLPTFIDLINGLLQIHSQIFLLSSHFSLAEETLIEDIPGENTEKRNYNRIELYSMKPSTDFDSLSKDISNLAQFISRFELIMNTEHNANKIYTQHIESGSLKIVWGSNTIELSGISDIIKAICDGINSFRITSSKKKLIDEQARNAKLDNDEKELAIINSKLDIIAHTFGLSTENAENAEKLQKMCLPILRYLVSNPQGKVGKYEYNLEEDIKLIEHFNA